jgi:hypothetical protein
MNNGNLQIKKNSTDVTLSVLLRDAFNGSPKTGVTLANLDMYYIRVETDNDVTISSKIDITALTGLTDPHTDNKAFEIGYGFYRIDLPDAVFAEGANRGNIIIIDGTAGTILQANIDFEIDSMVERIWRRFYKKCTQDADELKTYNDDDSVATTQTITYDGATKTVGNAI